MHAFRRALARAQRKTIEGGHLLLQERDHVSACTLVESPHFSQTFRAVYFTSRCWFFDGATVHELLFKWRIRVTPRYTILTFLLFQVSHLHLLCFLSLLFRKTRTYFHPPNLKVAGWAAHFMFIEKVRVDKSAGIPPQAFSTWLWQPPTTLPTVHSVSNIRKNIFC